MGAGAKILAWAAIACVTAVGCASSSDTPKDASSDASAGESLGQRTRDPIRGSCRVECAECPPGRPCPSLCMLVCEPRAGRAHPVTSLDAPDGAARSAELAPLIERPPLDDAPPIFGGGRCGPRTCDAGQVCCNESCGICTPPGGFCTEEYCGER